MTKDLKQPPSKRPTLTEAVKALRVRLDDTQQAFAQRLGLAISTVVRYESTRAPRGKALALLYKLAIDNGMHDVGMMFHMAMISELGAVSSYRLGDIELRLLMILQHIRNGEGTPPQKLVRAESEIAAVLKMVESINPYTTASSSDEEEDSK